MTLKEYLCRGLFLRPAAVADGSAGAARTSPSGRRRRAPRRHRPQWGGQKYAPEAAGRHLLPHPGPSPRPGANLSLFDISLGFEQEATGWENIYYRSYLQGETPRSVNDKIEAIAAFSELGDFLNMPVRYYSAGMMVRLAFSIATAVEPEVLLIDEVLSVGDMAFQEKARQRMREMMSLRQARRHRQSRPRVAAPPVRSRRLAGPRPGLRRWIDRRRRRRLQGVGGGPLRRGRAARRRGPSAQAARSGRRGRGLRSIWQAPLAPETPRLPTPPAYAGGSPTGDADYRGEGLSISPKSWYSMRVSCLCVSHNKPELAHEAIASIVHQTYPLWEAIVVDSGELSGAGYYERFAWRSDPRIKLVPLGGDGPDAPQPGHGPLVLQRVLPPRAGHAATWSCTSATTTCFIPTPSRPSFLTAAAIPRSARCTPPRTWG